MNLLALETAVLRAAIGLVRRAVRNTFLPGEDALEPHQRVRASLDRDHPFHSIVITRFTVRDHRGASGHVLGCVKARLRRNPSDSRP